jgi:hypothetical protein
MYLQAPAWRTLRQDTSPSLVVSPSWSLEDSKQDTSPSRSLEVQHFSKLLLGGTTLLQAGAWRYNTPPSSSLEVQFTKQELGGTA